MTGNYLFASDNQIHKVSKFDEHTVWFEKTVNKYGFSCWVTSKITECRPILLTEDILLKAGFEKNRFTKYPTFKLGKVEITNVEFFDEDSEGKEFSFKECKLSGLYGSDLFYFKSYSPNIKHFNQLQNLFKSLTGNDLKIEV